MTTRRWSFPGRTSHSFGSPWIYIYISSIQIHTVWCVCTPEKSNTYDQLWSMLSLLYVLSLYQVHSCLCRMGVSWVIGVPLVIIHFKVGFSLVNHPAVGGTPAEEFCGGISFDRLEVRLEVQEPNGQRGVFRDLRFNGLRGKPTGNLRIQINQSDKCRESVEKPGRCWWKNLPGKMVPTSNSVADETHRGSPSQVSRALAHASKFASILAAVRRKHMVICDTFYMLLILWSYMFNVLIPVCNGLLNLYAWVGRAWTM